MHAFYIFFHIMQCGKIPRDAVKRSERITGRQEVVNAAFFMRILKEEEKRYPK